MKVLTPGIKPFNITVYKEKTILLYQISLFAISPKISEPFEISGSWLINGLT
jgi:hypothetical protein